MAPSEVEQLLSDHSVVTEAQAADRVRAHESEVMHVEDEVVPAEWQGSAQWIRGGVAGFDESI